METDTLLYAAEVIAIFSFSLAGSIIGIQRELDAFGVVIMGIITSFGGGLLRDVCAGNFPPMVFESGVLVIVSCIVSVITFIIAYASRVKFKLSLNTINFINNIFDAIGLGLFTVIGVDVAIKSGYGDNAFFCIFLGSITGVGGGLLRDIMTKTTPFIFQKRIYALASILGASIYFYMVNFGVSEFAALFLATIVTFALRMLATFLEWSLPTVNLGENMVKREVIAPRRRFRKK